LKKKVLFEFIGTWNGIEKEFKSRQNTVNTSEIRSELMNSKLTVRSLDDHKKTNQSYKIATQSTADSEEKSTASTNNLVLNIYRCHPIFPKLIPFLNDTNI
jgi:hypothetical protein